MPIPGGADLNATVYKAITSTSSYFVKVRRDPGGNVGLAILELLKLAGVQPVIQPVKTIQNQLIQTIGNFSLVVFPFFDGKNGFDRNFTDSQWINLGKALKQVHNVEVPSILQSRIRRENYSPKWRKFVKSMYGRIEAGIDSDEIGSRLVQFMINHKPTIFRMIDRAEQLSYRVQTISAPFVLCHSDIHAGNVLVDQNEQIYIVDWDEPIWAPKERDLMFIGGGVAGVWNQPREEKLFYEGYGQTSIHPEIRAYYRYERIVEDIAEYAQELILNRSKSHDKEIMYKQCTHMFEPGNVIEIAFETDCLDVSL